jgi:hypothetical protein
MNPSKLDEARRRAKEGSTVVSTVKDTGAAFAKIVTFLPLTLCAWFPKLSSMPSHKATIHQPHDKLVKSTFSDPDNARAFLEGHLPRKLARRIDWKSLTLVSGSYIEPEFSIINHRGHRDHRE